MLGLYFLMFSRIVKSLTGCIGFCVRCKLRRGVGGAAERGAKNATGQKKGMRSLLERRFFGVQEPYRLRLSTQTASFDRRQSSAPLKITLF